MNLVKSENLNQNSDNNEILANEKGGIAIPAVMYFMGVPFFLVLLLWFFFFRG